MTSGSDTCRPIIVSIPHASSVVPEEVSDIVKLTPEEILHYTDLYTDQIFKIDDVHLSQAYFSRVIVDVNRAPDDISKEYKQAAEGVTVHTTWDGRSVYHEEPSEAHVEKLIDLYHDPYHRSIDDAIPHVDFLIDCHSFLPVGPKLKADSGADRPDVNLGNVNYSSCSREHTMFFRNFFENAGFTVSINFPYAGKYILGHHCHRRKIPTFLVPGIQIELNQGLYVKEGGTEPIPEKIDKFHQLFEMLVEELAKRL